MSGLAAWEVGRPGRWGVAALSIATGRPSAFVAIGLTSLAYPAVVEGRTPGLALPLYLVALPFWLAVVPSGCATGGRVRWAGRWSGRCHSPAWLAIVQFAARRGVLLAILAVVWLADIAAYFSGVRFGRHKLAPATVSPGKTWKAPSAPASRPGLRLRPAPPCSPATARYSSGALGSSWSPRLSILGDLFESLLKRQAGLKDSSGILPGHGGVLDASDSLTSTLPVVACLWLLSGRAGL